MFKSGSPKDDTSLASAIQSLLSHLNQALEIADANDLSANVGARIQHSIDTCLSELGQRHANHAGPNAKSRRSNLN
jgi:hypothetical protein